MSAHTEAQRALSRFVDSNAHGNHSDIVRAVVPLLEACIDEFENKGGSGADAFSEFILGRLQSLGLCRRVTERVEHVLPHPSNREGAMLIPVDVHGLLQEIVRRGWINTKCNILASAKPSGENR